MFCLAKLTIVGYQKKYNVLYNYTFFSAETVFLIFLSLLKYAYDLTFWLLVCIELLYHSKDEILYALRRTWSKNYDECIVWTEDCWKEKKQWKNKLTKSLDNNVIVIGIKIVLWKIQRERNWYFKKNQAYKSGWFCVWYFVPGEQFFVLLLQIYLFTATILKL